MASAGVEFIVIDEFNESLGADGSISLKIEPDRTSNNLDYEVLIPLRLKYSKKYSDSLLKIYESATGNAGLSTYR